MGEVRKRKTVRYSLSIMAQQEAKESNDDTFKHKHITVREIDNLSKRFKKCHKKDDKALKTLNAAQLYLSKYWGFYLSKEKNKEAMDEKIKSYYNSDAYS